MADMNTGIVALAAGLAIALTAIATSYAQGKIGSAAMALLAEKEEQRATVLILIAIPETMVILGFVVAVLIINQFGGV